MSSTRIRSSNIGSPFVKTGLGFTPSPVAVSLRLGACGHHFRAHAGILLEILHKAGRQLPAAGLIGRLILPGVGGDQQLAGHALDGGGHLDAEGGVGDELRLLDPNFTHTIYFPSVVLVTSVEL